MVCGLTVGVDHLQFAVGHIGFQIPGVLSLEVARARVGVPQRLLAPEGIQNGLCIGIARQALQGAQGGKENEKSLFLEALKGLLGTDPGGLELLGLVGHCRLALGHAGHQERHVEALWQVQRCRPVGQIPQLIHGKAPAARTALLVQRCLAIQLLDFGRGNRLAGPVIGQQDAQLFESLANPGQGLGDALGTANLHHAGTNPGQHMIARVGILILQPPTGEDIGIGKNTLVGAPRHQHFETGAVGAVAQQQQGRGIAGGHRLALGLKKLAGTGLAG